MSKAKIYTKESLETAIAESDSIADVIRYYKKPMSGSMYNQISYLIKHHNLDISHFTRTKNNSKITRDLTRKSPEAILIEYPDGHRRAKATMLTRALTELGIAYECAVCHISAWMDKPLTLDVDHIDGNYLDCRLHNLRFLCPNCHRQTDTFGKPKTKPTEKLICACGKPKTRSSKRCISCHVHPG